MFHHSRFETNDLSGMICGLAGGVAIARLLAAVLVDLSSTDQLPTGQWRRF
jgi:hypothetical protein